MTSVVRKQPGKKPVGIAHGTHTVSGSTIYGYVSGGGTTINKVPSSYLVSVYSKQMNVLVRAVMQENITTNITGRWEPVIGLGFLSGIVGTAPQYLGGVTLLRPWMTARMWRGTSPIGISMNLKFEAVDDADRNVFKACTKLQEMALPFWKRYKNDEGKHIGDLLAPPGPSAFMKTPYLKDTSSAGDEITIILGKMYTFRDVVISDVSTVVEPKFTDKGKPISATVNVKFETYTIMDRQNFQYAIGEADKPYEPKYSYDLFKKNVTGAAGTIAEAWSALTGQTSE